MAACSIHACIVRTGQSTTERTGLACAGKPSPVRAQWAGHLRRSAIIPNEKAWKPDQNEASEMELTSAEIQLLLESLRYSIQRVSDAQDTPYAVRQENLERLRALQKKLGSAT